MNIKPCYFDEYSQLQNISIENNINNNGNLRFTFFGMLDLLSSKHKIEPFVLKCFTDDRYIGYCIFYFKYNHTIHISQICLSKAYQNKGLAKQIIEHFKAAKGIDMITADIALENLQSKHFFEKNGFLMHKTNKEYYKAVYIKKIDAL